MAPISMATSPPSAFLAKARHLLSPVTEVKLDPRLARDYDSSSQARQNAVLARTIRVPSDLPQPRTTMQP